MSALKQSILNVVVLALAVVMGLGAYYVGSRIHHANQLYQATTQVLSNAKTLEALNQSIAQQQQRIDQLTAAEGNYNEQLQDLCKVVLEPDEK